MKAALKEDLSFLKKVPALAEATSNVDVPVPGYLYKDISSMTLENGGQYAEQVVDYILGALLEGSPTAKIKCLRVLQYALANGHANVRAVLSRKDTAIRRMANMSGSGPECQGIRLLAKDLLHAIHDAAAAAAVGVAASQQPLESSSLAMGQPQEGRSYSGLGSSSGTTAGKYQGFGNAPAASKTLTEQVTDGITKVVDKIAGRPASKAGGDSLTEGLPKFQPVTVRPAASLSTSGIASQTTVFPQAVRASAKPQKARKKGHAGGGWDDEDGDEGADDANVSGTLSDSASVGDSAKNSELSSCEPIAQVYEREVQAVEAFVDPCLEFPPSRKELDDARDRCTTLNADKVTQLLAAKIFASQESSQMRALVLIEALLRRGHINLSSQGALLLTQLQQLQGQSVDPVQVKAKKVFLIVQKLAEKPET
ncbi:AP-4 complex accessory subunit Tepsin-like [Haemaphysalis longicornis]